MTRFTRFQTLSLALIVSAGLATASPAAAAGGPKTRLAECRTGSCLVVSGRRDSAMTVVLINGHAVQVAGQHRWQVRLPLETVRTWSEPLARSISVVTYNPDTQVRMEREAKLPIGLLGHVNLDTLVIAVK